MNFVEDIRNKYLELIERSSDLKTLEDLKLSLLGKKGILTSKMRELGRMTNSDRLIFGPELNNVKKEFLELYKSKKQIFENELILKEIINEKIDVTKPSRKKADGTIHPISQVNEEIITIFSQ